MVFSFYKTAVWLIVILLALPAFPAVHTPAATSSAPEPSEPMPFTEEPPAGLLHAMQQIPDLGAGSMNYAGVLDATEQKVTAPGQFMDTFGTSVALGSDSALVGATRIDVNGNVDQGGCLLLYSQ